MSALRFRWLIGPVAVLLMVLAACGDTGAPRRGGSSFDSGFDNVSASEFDPVWDDYTYTAEGYDYEILDYVSYYPELDDLHDDEVLTYTAFLCADMYVHYDVSMNDALDDLVYQIEDDLDLYYYTYELQPLASAADTYVC